MKEDIPRVRYVRPYFKQCPGNFTFFLFLTECSITGSIFSRRVPFFGRKSIREYFIGKLGAFHGFFSYVGESRIINNPINSYVGESRIINNPINNYFGESQL